MTEDTREKAAKSAAELVAAHKLDGIDIDWEYPLMKQSPLNR